MNWHMVIASSRLMPCRSQNCLRPNSQLPVRTLWSMKSSVLWMISVGSGWAFVGDLRQARRSRPVPDVSHVGDLHLVAFHFLERAEIDTRSVCPDEDFLSDVLLHDFSFLMVSLVFYLSLFAICKCKSKIYFDTHDKKCVKKMKFFT